MKKKNSTKNTRLPARLPPRLLGLDALRGLIILIMALDHVAWVTLQGRPTDAFWGGHYPAPMSWPRFITYLLPHFCATGFFILMGVGMALFSASRLKKGWSENKITGYFIKRGFLLIFLQFTLENFVWFFFTNWNPDNWFYFGVLFSLGSAMIFTGLVMRFFSNQAFLLSLVFLLVSPLFVPDPASFGQSISWLLGVLFVPGRAGVFSVYFPVFSWAALALFGAAYGKLLLKEPEKWLKRSLWVGVMSLIAFVFFRVFGGVYGNLRPLELMTAQDLFSMVKYPPSLAFICFTLSGCAFALYAVSSLPPIYSHLFVVFGKVPLFFYILHLYLLIGLWQFTSETGEQLPAVYLLWVGVLVVSYPFCVWYARFKFRQPIDSVWRLF